MLWFRDVLAHFSGGGLPLSPLTLRFLDPVVEARYRATQYRVYLPFLRVALVLALLLYAGFGIADIFVIPDLVHTAWVIRYAIVCPLILAVLLLSFTPAFERLHQPVLSLMILIGGLGVDYMAVTAAPPGNYTYYVGALIIVFYTFHFLRIDFVKSLVLAWTSFAFYEVGALAFDTTPLGVAIANSFFFVTTNLVAMLTGYLQEYMIRRDFLQRSQLDESRRQLDSMAANVPGVVFRLVRHVDGRLSFPYIAEGIRESFDRDPDLLRAHPESWSDGIHPDDRHIWHEAYRRAVASDGPLEAVVRVIGEHGGVKWMRMIARARRRPNGDVVWDGICLDITELKDREDELRQVVKMEAIGRLTGGIAHDFNNMLTAMIGNLELLHDAVPDDPAVVRCVEAALLAADRSAELTGRLLAFSRKQPLAPRATDINGLVRSVAELVRPSLTDSIALELKLDSDAWPAIIDPGQLESSLLNLALNGIDAMADGGTLSLDTRNLAIDAPLDTAGGTLEAGDYVMVSVADTGVGMSPEVAEQAFEPFFTTKVVGQGSGLGVSMVYGFAQQSGGQVVLNTTPGAGTTFSLYLPRAPADVDSQGAADQPELAVLPVGDELVMVVEDEAAVRDFIDRTLSGLGYRVIGVRDSRAALALLARGLRPALLLANAGPSAGIGTLELAERVRQQVPDIAVVLMTAGDRAGMRRDDGGAAIAAVLEKPFNRRSLANCARAALDAAAKETSQAEATAPV